MTSTTKPWLIIGGIVLAALAGYTWIVFERGRTYERNLILSQKPDTSSTQSAPVVFKDTTAQTVGTPRPRTDAEKEALKRVVGFLVESNDSLQRTTTDLQSENDLLRNLLTERLSPYTVTIEQGTEGVSGKDTLRLNYVATINTDPATRLTDLLMKFAPFTFPEREISRPVPIPAVVPWYDPYHWMVIGAALYALIASLL